MVAMVANESWQLLDSATRFISATTSYSYMPGRSTFMAVMCISAVTSQAFSISTISSADL